MLAFSVVFLTISVFSLGAHIVSRFLENNAIESTTNGGRASFEAYDMYSIILVLFSALFLYLVSSVVLNAWKKVKHHQTDSWTITDVLSILLGLAFMGFFGYVLGSKVIYQFF